MTIVQPGTKTNDTFHMCACVRTNACDALRYGGKKCASACCDQRRIPSADSLPQPRFIKAPLFFAMASRAFEHYECALMRLLSLGSRALEGKALGVPCVGVLQKNGDVKILSKRSSKLCVLRRANFQIECCANCYVACQLLCMWSTFAIAFEGLTYYLILIYKICK